MELENVSKVNIRKSNDLNELEKMINDCIIKQEEENFRCINVELIPVDTYFIAVLSFKTCTLKVLLSKKKPNCQVKILSESNLSKLEKKINSLITEMQDEHYFMSIPQISKNGNNFVAIINFEFCNNYVSHL